jgi:hypothetical protein
VISWFQAFAFKWVNVYRYARVAHPYPERKQDPNKDPSLHCIYYMVGLNAVDPQLERRLVSILETTK